MRTIARCLATVLGLFIVVGCASTGTQEDAVGGLPAAVAANGKALLVLCRASALKGVAWGHHYYVDNQPVVELSSGAYTHINLSPREVVISSGPIKNPTFISVKVKAEAGHIYYVIDDPGNTFASYESLTISSAEMCYRGSRKYQSPSVNTVE